MLVTRLKCPLPGFYGHHPSSEGDTELLGMLRALSLGGPAGVAFFINMMPWWSFCRRGMC